MKRTSKQLLSVLLAIVMVVSLAVPALGATPILGESETAVETPVSDTPAAASTSGTRPSVGVSAGEPARLSTAIEGANTAQPEESGTFVLDPKKNDYGLFTSSTSDETLTDAKYWVNDYFVGSAGVKIKSNINGIELAKQEGANVSFTVTGKATVTAVIGNGSGGKACAVALKNTATGQYVKVVSAVKAPDGAASETAVPSTDIVDESIVLQCGGYSYAYQVNWGEVESGTYQIVAANVPTDKMPATIGDTTGDAAGTCTYAAGGDTDPNAKAARFYDLTVVQDASSAGGAATTNVYTFDATKIANGVNDAGTVTDKIDLTNAELQSATTKNDAALAEGDEYFAIFKDEVPLNGETVQYMLGKRNGTTNLKGVELQKLGSAGLNFTVEGTATVTLSLCSTGKSNGSTMGLVKVSDKSLVAPTAVSGGVGRDSNSAAVEGVVSVIADGTTTYKSTATAETGDITPPANAVVVYGNNSDPTTVTYNLTAGEYRITTTAGANRGGWLITATVSDTVEATTQVTDAYTFDATKLANGVNDAGTVTDKIDLTNAELQSATTKNDASLAEGDEYFAIFKDEAPLNGETVQYMLGKRNGTTNLKGVELQKLGSAGLNFTVEGTATVTLSLCSTGKSNGSTMGLVKVSDKSLVAPTAVSGGVGRDSNSAAVEGVVSVIADGTTTYKSTATAETGDITPPANAVVVYGNNSDPTTVTYNLTAGEYRITTTAGANRGGWLITATVSDTHTVAAGKTIRVKADWTVDGIGAATASGAQTADTGKIAVTVEGPKTGRVTTTSGADKIITTYADAIVVTMESTDGVEVGTEKVVNGVATFSPSATGSYVAKVYAQREGEEADLLVGEITTPIAFTLPLAVPAINSAASNGAGADGTVSVTVMWSKVPEATSYNIQKKLHSAETWEDAVSVAATDASNVSYTFTGLTADGEYDYRVQAVRGSDTTDWSAVETAGAAAKKQIPWTTKVFGTSTTVDYNVVISEDNKGSYTNELGWKPVTTWENGTYTFSVTDNNGKTRPETYEGLTGDLNTDPQGRVLLSSQNGAGKITEGSSDGMMFYYTPIPAGTNYTLEADVHVIDWNTRDSQNGFGLAALDRVPAESWSGTVLGNSANYWNNSYMAGGARLSFYYDGDTGTAYAATDKGADAFTGYSYYIGLVSVAKYGTNLKEDGTAYDGTANPANFVERRFPLDTRLCVDGKKVKVGTSSNRFNTIGNYSTQPAGFSLLNESSAFMSGYEITDMRIVLQKSNTGYTTTIYDMSGNKLGSNTEYFRTGAMSLSDTNNGSPFSDSYLAGHSIPSGLEKNLDTDYEYVGMFTSRDAQVLYKNVKLTTIAAEDDAAEQEPPTTYVTPKMSISSGNSSNSASFKLSISTNVDGTATVSQNGVVVGVYNDVQGDIRYDVPVTLKEGNNSFTVQFQPDPNQDLGEYIELANTETLQATSVVKYESFYGEMTNLYVAPNGLATAYGTRTRPLDVHTAISVVRPGQNIILLEGVYDLTKTIRINRGMDGTEDAPIYFMTDVDENGDPVKVVLNGQSKVGSVLVAGSDWWVFKDFEVVGSSNNSTAFQVSGSHNVVQNVSTHDNGSSGLAISRLSSSDHLPVRDAAAPLDQSKVTDWGDWPCDNLILNCTSYRNYDTGYQGADGFCCKIYAGSGNVFDGCVAYWNADDGWDLYAKTGEEEGVIGKVILRNCVTFENGYEVRKLADEASQIPYYEEDGYTPVLNLNDDGTVKLTDAGNGNGFKLGGSHLPGPHEISNSFAFFNKAKGFDSNNGPDISVLNCTAYNNGDENIGLGSKYEVLGYKVVDTVSFKDENCKIGPSNTAMMADANPTGDQCVYNYYKWDGKKSAHITTGTEITADSFKSLSFSNAAWIDGAPRDADGSLDLGDFLQLKDITDAGAGELVNGTTPDSKVVDPAQDTVIDTSNGGTGGTGGGGTIGGAGQTGTGSGSGTTEADKTYTAKEKTSTSGDTTITVTEDKTGEVVAEVKLPATIPAPEAKFEDVPEGHWAEQSINNMAGLGIVKGVGDNKYDMDSAVTRGALATMLFRFANGKEGKTNNFADVASGQWYTDAIAWAADVGVVTGYSDSTFGPNDTITREQLAVMLWRFAKLIGMDGAAEASLDGYGDAGSVSSWAEDGMNWCVEKGIINGVSADTLSPSTSATRAQTATMLDRFIGLMK